MTWCNMKDYIDAVFIFNRGMFLSTKLPNHNLLIENQEYYKFMLFMVQLVRDNRYEKSIYVGDPFSDEIEELLYSSLTLHNLFPYISILIEIASNLERIIPQGVIEDLRILKFNSRDVHIYGKIHETDYR